jgi:aminoglycoside phosphotransferase (APT) family kinase protein
VTGREFSRVGDIFAAHSFDVAALDVYLRRTVADFQGPLSVRQFHGGASNPTFLLTDDASGRRYVLRKKPPGALLGSAHAVEREYRVMRALAPTSVPVPEMLCLCEDAGILGTPFYVMPFLSGRIYNTNRLEDMAPAERAVAYKDAARVLARLHAVDYIGAGLASFGKPGEYFARQIARWTRQYRASETETIPSMDWLIDTLAARIPALDETAIVHGDYRLENLMFHPTEPRIIAVLDWELATLGHPLADLAFFCLFHHAHFMPWGSARTIDYAESGIPSETSFVAAYCEAAGRSGIEDWPFLLSFAAFRLAAIAQGVHRRALDGASMASSGRNGALDWAELAQALAEKEALPFFLKKAAKNF